MFGQALQGGMQQALAMMGPQGAPPPAPPGATPPIAPPGTGGNPAPQDVEVNKGLWRGFLDKLRNDPDFRQSVLVATTGLMRSPKPGENGLDVASQALQSGIGTLQSLRDARQGRADKQKQQEFENSIAGRQVGVQEQNANTNATGTAAQVAQGDRRVATDELRAGLEGRRTAADEKRADADMIRAQADRLRAETFNTNGGSLNQGQNVALVKMRAQALRAQNPALTEDQAALQAQNELLLSKGKTPGQIAADLYSNSVKTWSERVENIGKPLPPELNNQFAAEARERAVDFYKLGQPTQPTQGQPPAQQPGVPPTAPPAAAAPPSPQAAPSPATAVPPAAPQASTGNQGQDMLNSMLAEGRNAPLVAGATGYQIQDSNGVIAKVLDVQNGQARVQLPSGAIKLIPEATARSMAVRRQ